MKIEWTQGLELGDADIDKQHQELFSLINEIIAVDSMRDLRGLIMLLYKHIREHFAAEEALMARIEFPDLDHHTENHNRLLSRLNELSMDVGKGYMNKPAIVELMKDWALNHVSKDDQAIRRYMRASA
ncbi:MAG: bacteriohemerythrin [Rhodoferax sp.]